MKTPVVLSIAGSDNTGGAGIQADIKTCCALSVYAATAISGVTAQNPRGVYGVEPVSLKMLRLQIDSIFEVMRPDAVKTGMLPSPEIIEVVAEKMVQYGVENLVVDPVMVATNGGALVAPGEDTLNAFRNTLLPLASVVTPNLSEASAFLGTDVNTLSVEDTCRSLLDIMQSRSVLLKGGHSSGNEAADFLYDGINLSKFASPRINSKNTHGTGCTFSTAIACGLAKGESLEMSVTHAKQFLSKAIQGGVNLNIMESPGPLDFLN